MKISEFKKLEKKINNHNFSDSYRSINRIIVILSYFGHLVSIFLAFFFMSKILETAMPDNKYAVFITSIIILSGLELLKRDIFDKFSIQSIKEKGITNMVTPLLISSLLLISASFYSSINGAKEFSYKSKEIEIKNESQISLYRDSINNVYNLKIENYENKNNELFESNKLLDEEARQLPPTWVSNKNKIRDRIDINNEQIEKNDLKIKELKEELDSKISDYESTIIKKGEEEKKENSNNSFIFILISTLIELVILGGVYFSEYYRYRSYREFRDKIEKDPNYQKWLLYDEMLSIILTEETKMNEKLPNNKVIIEMCQVNDIIVLPKDVTDFIKVLSGLGIVKSAGNLKYLNKTKEVAQDILRKKFNIE